MHVVAAKGLQKMFGQRWAVVDIDFTVNKGECFGFLGPNGAGKTTTIQIILGLVEKTAGDLKVFGQEIPEQLRQVKSRIGVVPQNDNLDTDLTVLENLVTYASYYNLVGSKAKRRSEELLDFFALENRRNDVIDHLSGGQRRRLLLARALVHDPELLILDEPTVGLDPQARYLIWQRLKKLKEEGVTMMLTSHYMDEVARLSDRVMILDQGQVVVEGEPSRLVTELVGMDVFELICSKSEAAQLEKIAKQCGARSEIMPEGIFLYTRKDCPELDRHIRPLQQWLKRPANLEDLFIQLTGRSLHES
jgi:lipooligosaccharide transport system ATP-binding protein